MSTLTPVAATVLLHHCALHKQPLTEEGLVAGENYVSTEPNWYQRVPGDCHCAKKVSFRNAQKLCELKEAYPVIRKKRGRLEPSDTAVWCPLVAIQDSTPRMWRTHVLSHVDLEKAYVNGDRKAQEHVNGSLNIAFVERAELFYGANIKALRQLKMQFPRLSQQSLNRVISKYLQGLPVKEDNFGDGRPFFIAQDKRTIARSSGRSFEEISRCMGAKVKFIYPKTQMGKHLVISEEQISNYGIYMDCCKLMKQCGIPMEIVDELSSLTTHDKNFMDVYKFRTVKRTANKLAHFKQICPSLDLTNIAEVRQLLG